MKLFRIGLLRAVFAGFVLAFAGAAMAQEVAPEQFALARKYVDLTDKASVFEIALVQVGVDTMRTLVSQSPDSYDAVDAAITKVLESYKTRKGELMDQFARVYAQQFTMDELQQIVDFYSSPTGQKLATAQSNTNDDLQTIMSLFQINLRTEFFAAVRAELRTAGVNL